MQTPLIPVVALAAMFGGALIAAQGPIYTRLATGLGQNALAAVFLAFLTATVATGLVLLTTGQHRTITLPGLAGLPLWVWLGGLFGAVHVVISIQAIPLLGASIFMVCVVTGSLLGAAVYDHFGWMGLTRQSVSPLRLAGLSLVILGVYCAARG